MRDTGLRRVAALLLAAAFLVCGAASYSQTLHEWLHTDAGHEQHECGITTLASGHASADAPEPAFLLHRVLTWREWLSAYRPVWVAGVFGVTAVQEHAPPVLA